MLRDYVSDHPIEESRVRLLKPCLKGIFACGLKVFYRFISGSERRADFGIHNPIKGKLNILGSQLPAVMKPHPFTQIKSIHPSVRRDIPGISQIRSYLSPGIYPDQAVKDKLDYCRGNRAGGQHRIDCN